jgi:hypothetical protein
MLIVVPPLPVCSNPERLLAFYQCRNLDISIYKYPAFAEAYSRDFVTLAYNGDKYLTTLSWKVISQLFGLDNRQLAGLVFSDWISNKNWMLLAVSYRLDRYVGWAPRDYVSLLSNGGELSVILRAHSGKRPKGEIKYWADIWEAWWGCIIIERELWNEDTRDIETILRTLISKKYHSLLQFSTHIYTMETDNPRFDIDEKRVEITEILRSNQIIEEWIGPGEDDVKSLVLGYLAKVAIPDTKRYITSYAITEKDALNNIVEFADSSHSRSSLLRVN